MQGAVDAAVAAGEDAVGIIAGFEQLQLAFD